MAGRRRSESGDSLELLLDTVCNVFGGIIFVAMLISILTSNAADQVVTDHQDKIRAVNDGRQANVIRERISQWQAGLDEIGKTTATVGTNDALRARHVIEMIEQRKKESQERSLAAEQWLQRFAELESQASDQLERRLREAQAGLARQERDTGEIRNAKTIQGRLPIERRTRKRQVVLIVSGARAYVIPVGAARSILVAGGHGNDVDMRLAGSALAVTLKAQGGFAVDQQVQQNERLKSLIAMLNASEDFVDMFVTADAAHAFNHLRNAITARGFSYNIHPVKPRQGEFIFGETDKVFEQ